MPRAQCLTCCSLGSSPVKKPGLLKVHPLEGDPFDSGSEASEGTGPCVSSLSVLIGTVAETSEEKFRLLDQRDRVMRQGTVAASPQGPRFGQVGTARHMQPLFYRKSFEGLKVDMSTMRIHV